ncbi:alpha/beta fold hydrolase [bacterium]|nr:alpha/beta fold hydrolase [bacterium]
MKTHRFVFFAVICCQILLMTSCNQNASKRGAVKTESFVDVGTHKLRVMMSDLPSDCTIVLEAGGGEFSSAYEAIQDTLAKSTGMRVISYDRAGFGESELGPEKMSGIDEVENLMHCLEALGIHDNLILAGHSYGGLLVQIFAFKYPERVKGLVLIDPMNVRFVDRFGLENLNAVTPYFENPVENHEKAGNRMVDYFSETIAVLRGWEIPADIPVVLLTAGIPPVAPDVWRQAHEDMVADSENHKMVIAEGNHHHIIYENPELVLHTLIEMAQRISGR